MGAKSGASCIHRLVRKVDAGEIYARKDFCFPDTCQFPQNFDDYISVQAKELVCEWLPELLKNRSPGTEILVDASQSEYWPRLNTHIHGWIDWSWGLEEIKSFCHAFSYPHGGARTLVNGDVLEIRNCSIEFEQKFHPYQTGLIFRKTEDLFIAHREGVLRISDYCHTVPTTNITVGDRLYTPRQTLEAALSQRVQYMPSGKVVDAK
jgi:methionyl-tRNA formyltransferase